MPSDEPPPPPMHRTLRLTPERPRSTGYRIARGALIVYAVTVLAATAVTCSCPGFFVVMAICAIVALLAGSRVQRVTAAVLLIAALAGVVSEVRTGQRMRERLHHAQEQQASGSVR